MKDQNEKNEKKEEIEVTQHYLEDLNRDINAQIERTSLRLHHLAEIQKTLLEEHQRLKETGRTKSEE